MEIAAVKGRYTKRCSARVTPLRSCGQLAGLAFFQVRQTEQQQLDEVSANLQAQPE
jgi:hypothetical protein